MDEDQKKVARLQHNLIFLTRKTQSIIFV